jgi:hypothetical protein
MRNFKASLYIVISIRWCIYIRYCFAYAPLNPVNSLSNTFKGLFKLKKALVFLHKWT